MSQGPVLAKGTTVPVGSADCGIVPGGLGCSHPAGETGTVSGGVNPINESVSVQYESSGSC